MFQELSNSPVQIDGIESNLRCLSRWVVPKNAMSWCQLSSRCSAWTNCSLSSPSRSVFVFAKAIDRFKWIIFAVILAFIASRNAYIFFHWMQWCWIKCFFFSESELCQLHFKHLYHSFAFVLSLLCTEIGQTVWLVLKTPREWALVEARDHAQTIHLHLNQQPKNANCTFCPLFDHLWSIQR